MKLRFNFSTLSVVAFTIATVACTTKPTPIQYGKEACSFCRMSIVDNQYGTQLVSDKGKTFSFDAIECMVNFEEVESHSWMYRMATPYSRPGVLVPIDSLSILRSPKLPSPMGANLTAEYTGNKASKLQAQYGGDLLTYGDLIDKEY